MKIYTKTGDEGETSLFTGERVPKSDPFIEALGTIDEANSSIGLAISLLDPSLFSDLKSQLLEIQHALFDLGAALATPRTRASAAKIEKTRFDEHGTKLLEQWIDAMHGELTPLKNFVLPGGHAAAAAIHLARSIVRRGERGVQPIYKDGECSKNVLIYLNRLSDYLFTAARLINARTSIEEPIWQHTQTSQPRV